MDVLLILTDYDNDTQIFLIPGEDPVAKLAMTHTGEEYFWPDEDESDRDEEIEALYKRLIEKRDDWHQGEASGGPMALPQEPVLVAHLCVSNTPE